MMHVDDPQESLDVTAAQIETLTEQSGLTQAGRVMQIASVLSELEDRLKYTLSKRVLIEMALIRCARVATVVSIEEILSQINALKTQLGGGAPEAPVSGNTAGMSASSDAASAGEPTAEASVSPPAAPEESRAQALVKEERSRYDAPRSGLAEAESDDVKELVRNWGDIIQKVDHMAVGSRAALLDAIPLRIEKDVVVIGFDPEFAAEKDRFKSTRNLKALQHVLSSTLKRSVKAAFEIAKDGIGPVPAETGDGAPPDTQDSGAAKSPDEPDGKTEKKKGKRTMAQWASEPPVQKTLEMFDGTIVGARE